tara:strand:+ start:209 stop:406 length:198 start_codon:yes stop_codon:yes gene_type:complete
MNIDQVEECTQKHYKIIRFRRNPTTEEVTRRVIKKRVTLTEAQEHCSNDKTHGVNWFDGYDDLTD